MILNKEGKLIGLPRNEQATTLANLATPADIVVLKAKLGDHFIYTRDYNLEEERSDYIPGIALMCEPHEVQ